MKSGIKPLLVLLMAALILITLSPMALAAIKVDEGLVDLAFQKLYSLDDSTKSEAIGLLKVYFSSQESLNTLKQDPHGILKLVIGDDYEKKL